MSNCKARFCKHLQYANASNNQQTDKSRLNCLGSTAGSHRRSGSECQILGPATENAVSHQFPPTAVTTIAKLP